MCRRCVGSAGSSRTYDVSVRGVAVSQGVRTYGGPQGLDAGPVVVVLPETAVPDVYLPENHTQLAFQQRR
ncbi:hypothetical protein M2271_007625 [Streptomyces sp. LBL]|nr:hypothetical protein [Streptomyces sp. LBL]